MAHALGMIMPLTIDSATLKVLLSGPQMRLGLLAISTRQIAADDARRSRRSRRTFPIITGRNTRHQLLGSDERGCVFTDDAATQPHLASPEQETEDQ